MWRRKSFTAHPPLTAALTDSPPRSRAWILTCTLLVLASGALWFAAVRGLASPQVLAWRASGWQTAPWTLWSAPLEHFLLPHALANALALMALGLLGSLISATRKDAWALLLAWPISTLGLILWPDQVGGFYGLSGVIHAAAAILTLRAIGSPATYRIGQILAACLLFKLALERAWAVPVGFDANWGFNVVYAAHLTGAVAGAAAALVVQTIESIRHQPPPADPQPEK